MNLLDLLLLLLLLLLYVTVSLLLISPKLLLGSRRSIGKIVFWSGYKTPVVETLVGDVSGLAAILCGLATENRLNFRTIIVLNLEPFKLLLLF